MKGAIWKEEEIGRVDKVLEAHGYGSLSPRRVSGLAKELDRTRVAILARASQIRMQRAKDLRVEDLRQRGENLLPPRPAPVPGTFTALSHEACQQVIKDFFELVPLDEMVEAGVGDDLRRIVEVMGASGSSGAAEKSYLGKMVAKDCCCCKEQYDPWEDTCPKEVTKDPWAHRSAGMVCATCMWFAEKPATQVVGRDKIGRCRRHAPTMNGYPVVYGNDWCGDREADEEKG
jgi:hypothetical protein